MQRRVLLIVVLGAVVTAGAAWVGWSDDGSDAPGERAVTASEATTSASSSTTEATTTTAPEPQWDTDAPDPATVVIPKIGVEAPVIELGLNPDKTLETPTDYSETGWWVGGSGVGEPGPALITGHVDSWRGPAVFYRLDELDVGDEAHVVRDDGSTRSFVVYEKEQVPKDSFPTERVYGPTEVPELRLVTCGGTFDRSVRHYDDNIILYMRIAEAAGTAA